MAIQRQHPHPSPSVSDIRVRLKDSNDAAHEHDDRKRLTAKSDREARRVGRHVKPEDAEEEVAEGVEHLDEEVPPQPDIRREVREK